MGRMDGKVAFVTGAGAPVCQSFHVLAIPWVTPEDISSAGLFLAPDEARYVTGVALPIDAGSCLK